MKESRGLWHAAMRWLVILVIVQPVLALGDGTIRIHLTQNARIDTEQFTLAQIADILAPNPEQAASLGTIAMGRSPLPGQSLWVHHGKVRTILRQHGWDPRQIEITATGPVKVTRNYATVSAERIGSAVVAFIKRNAPWSKGQMKIRPIRYRQSYELPPGEVSLIVTAPKHTDWLGGIPFRVRIKVDGRTVRRTSVPAYIEVWQNVVLTAKPLGKNQPITAADIQIEKMNLARVPSKAIFEREQVIGKRSSQTIAANTVLCSHHVHEPLMVRRGDVVQVFAESKVLRITTQAVAKQNGVFGDNIEVMNIRSKKRFFAEVIEAQTVKVDF